MFACSSICWCLASRHSFKIICDYHEWPAGMNKWEARMFEPHEDMTSVYMLSWHCYALDGLLNVLLWIHVSVLHGFRVLYLAVSYLVNLLKLNWMVKLMFVVLVSSQLVSVQSLGGSLSLEVGPCIHRPVRGPRSTTADHCDPPSLIRKP